MNECTQTYPHVQASENSSNVILQTLYTTTYANDTTYFLAAFKLKINF